MLSLQVDRRVKGELETIWQILTDMNCFTEAAPDVVRTERLSGEAIGMVRRIHHKSGYCWEEECIDWQPLDSFTMQIRTDDYLLPVSFMRRITCMEQKQKNVVIKIHYEYTPKYEPFGYLINKHKIRPVLKIFARQLIDNLARKIMPKNIDASINAATIIKEKDPVILTIIPETPISEACKILTNKRIGCLIVLNRQNEIAGVLSERDIINAIANAGESILHKPASEYMTKDVVFSHAEDNLAELMTMMSNHRIRHLPVVDNDKLTGVISIGDIINARMKELELESTAMHQYIEGRKWREVAMQIGHSTAAEKFT